MASTSTSSTKENYPKLLAQGSHASNAPIPLSRPVTLVGSHDKARLHLLSRTISACHCVFIVTDAGVYVRDLASRTHTLVNGKQVREAMLRDGDEIEIGTFLFRFIDFKHAPKAVPAPPAQVMVAGSTDVIPMAEKVLLFGHRPTCDVSLLENSASTAHAIIYERNGKRHLRDLGSRKGTFLNGKAIHDEEIHFGDTFLIGETTFQYDAYKAPSATTAAIDELEHLIGTAPLLDAPVAPAKAISSIPVSSHDSVASGSLQASKPSVAPLNSQDLDDLLPLESNVPDPFASKVPLVQNAAQNAAQNAGQIAAPEPQEIPAEESAAPEPDISARSWRGMSTIPVDEPVAPAEIPVAQVDESTTSLPLEITADDVVSEDTNPIDLSPALTTEAEQAAEPVDASESAGESASESTSEPIELDLPPEPTEFAHQPSEVDQPIQPLSLPHNDEPLPLADDVQPVDVEIPEISHPSTPANTTALPEPVIEESAEVELAEPAQAKEETAPAFSADGAETESPFFDLAGENTNESVASIDFGAVPVEEIPMFTPEPEPVGGLDLNLEPADAEAPNFSSPEPSLSSDMFASPTAHVENHSTDGHGSGNGEGNGEVEIVDATQPTPESALQLDLQSDLQVETRTSSLAMMESDRVRPMDVDTLSDSVFGRQVEDLAGRNIGHPVEVDLPAKSPLQEIAQAASALQEAQSAAEIESHQAADVLDEVENEADIETIAPAIAPIAPAGDEPQNEAAIEDAQAIEDASPERSARGLPPYTDSAVEDSNESPDGETAAYNTIEPDSTAHAGDAESVDLQSQPEELSPLEIAEAQPSEPVEPPPEPETAQPFVREPARFEPSFDQQLNLRFGEDEQTITPPPIHEPIATVNQSAFVRPETPVDSAAIEPRTPESQPHDEPAPSSIEAPIMDIGEDELVAPEASIPVAESPEYAGEEVVPHVEPEPTVSPSIEEAITLSAPPPDKAFEIPDDREPQIVPPMTGTMEIPVYGAVSTTSSDPIDSPVVPQGVMDVNAPTVEPAVADSAETETPVAPPVAETLPPAPEAPKKRDIFDELFGDIPETNSAFLGGMPISLPDRPSNFGRVNVGFDAKPIPAPPGADLPPTLNIPAPIVPEPESPEPEAPREEEPQVLHGGDPVISPETALENDLPEQLPEPIEQPSPPAQVKKKPEAPASGAHVTPPPPSKKLAPRMPNRPKAVKAKPKPILQPPKPLVDRPVDDVESDEERESVQTPFDGLGLANPITPPGENNAVFGGKRVVTEEDFELDRPQTGKKKTRRPKGPAVDQRLVRDPFAIGDSLPADSETPATDSPAEESSATAPTTTRFDVNSVERPPVQHPMRTGPVPPQARRKSHTSRLLLILVSSLLAMGAAVLGIFFGLPPTARLTASLGFANVADPGQFVVDQRQKLTRNDSATGQPLRTTVIEQLQGARPGFLGDQIAYARMIDRIAWDAQSNRMVLSMDSTDAAGDKVRLRELFRTLYTENKSLSDTAARLRAKVEQAQKEERDLRTELERIKTSMEVTKRAGDERPAASELESLKAASKKAHDAHEAAFRTRMDLVIEVEKLKQPIIAINPADDPGMRKLAQERTQLGDTLGDLKSRVTQARAALDGAKDAVVRLYDNVRNDQEISALVVPADKILALSPEGRSSDLASMATAISAKLDARLKSLKESDENLKGLIEKRNAAKKALDDANATNEAQTITDAKNALQAAERNIEVRAGEIEQSLAKLREFPQRLKDGLTAVDSLKPVVDQLEPQVKQASDKLEALTQTIAEKTKELSDPQLLAERERERQKQLEARNANLAEAEKAETDALAAQETADTRLADIRRKEDAYERTKLDNEKYLQQRERIEKTDLPAKLAEIAKLQADVLHTPDPLPLADEIVRVEETRDTRALYSLVAVAAIAIASLLGVLSVARRHEFDPRLPQPTHEDQPGQAAA